MPRLIWSQSALQDVARLHAFLKPKNPDAAKRAVRAIRQGVRILAMHPEIGRPVEDMPSEFREWPIDFGRGGYIALYRRDRNSVIVLTVKMPEKPDIDCHVISCSSIGLPIRLEARPQW